MIRLTPPLLALTPPPRPQSNRLRPVLPVGEGMSVAECGGAVRVDLYGEVHNGRMVTLLTPADAQRLAMELGILARQLGA